MNVKLLSITFNDSCNNDISSIHLQSGLEPQEMLGAHCLPSLRHCLVTSRSMLKKTTVTYSFIRVRSSVSLVSLLCSIKPGSQSLQPVRNCHWNYSIQGVRPTVCWALCSLGLRDSKMQNTTHENFPVNEREPRYAVDWATLHCRESNTNPGLEYIALSLKGDSLTCVHQNHL